MKISTRGRYAIRILLDIALHDTDGPVIMKEIALRQDISKKYGDQIAMQLTQAGILRSIRGRQGGYCLAKDPSRISMLNVLSATELCLTPVECLMPGPHSCDRCVDYFALPFWEGLDKVMNEYMASVTLQDLLNRSESPENGKDCPYQTGSPG